MHPHGPPPAIRLDSENGAHREQALPWDISNIIFASFVPPAVGALAAASAYAEGVVAFTRPGVGTSGTAKTRSASSRCAAGRRPSDKKNAVIEGEIYRIVTQPSC